MKTRLNLTIEDRLLAKMKIYAKRQGKSVSVLVEEYFESLTRPAKRRNIVDRVGELEKPEIDPSIDLKELFYRDQAKKYGF